ncbi:DUF4112 domain-containing protein [Psychromarinibacter sp. C21-152]|uniref:DUF4112 domain-containing protein n=1 Tax=Psychromarinibacter sediminicola TaxID=3033385 RepID=A0AAE3NMH4_9RHOB|nr:DUF4112 domain-containing protein [Psychromarinibacter sediminicola]MDF0600043.1 DUF4112 domain-containing protein [Psychromarinibacter sediminicola]
MQADTAHGVQRRPAARPRPLSAYRRDELARLEDLAHRMDTMFRIPMTEIRVGLDTILGLIPGIGDTATAIPAGYIVYRGYKLGAPKSLLVRMGVNAGIDWLIGSIPLVGDLFDLGFKANRRNVRLLRRHFERTAAPA